MESFTKKEQIVIIIVCFIVITSLGFKFIIKDRLKPSGMVMDLDSTEDIEEDLNLGDLKEDVEKEKNEEGIEIMVHISGQVYKPGIIRLVSGKRLIDGVELAGGLKSEADLDKINLAKKLLDEEKIYIPRIGEEIDLNIVSEESDEIQSGESSEKININTSTREELISLPGVGEVIVDRIIEYRLENEFKTIEEIKSVSGIGDKKFEGMKELIIVN